MALETEFIYREEQRFGLWLRRLIVGSMALAAGLSIFSLIKTPCGEDPSKASEILTVAVAGILVPIVLVGLFGALVYAIVRLGESKQ